MLMIPVMSFILAFSYTHNVFLSYSTCYPLLSHSLGIPFLFLPSPLFCFWLVDLDDLMSFIRVAYGVLAERLFKGA